MEYCYLDATKQTFSGAYLIMISGRQYDTTYLPTINQSSGILFNIVATIENGIGN